MPLKTVFRCSKCTESYRVELVRRQTSTVAHGTLARVAIDNASPFIYHMISNCIVEFINNEMRWVSFDKKKKCTESAFIYEWSVESGRRPMKLFWLVRRWR